MSVIEIVFLMMFMYAMIRSVFEKDKIESLRYQLLMVFIGLLINFLLVQKEVKKTQEMIKKITPIVQIEKEIKK